MNPSNFIKKINQRLFELGRTMGTDSDAYQRAISQISKVAEFDVEIRSRKSKGSVIDVYQIPNTKANQKKVTSSRQYVNSERLPSTAKEILESSARTLGKVMDKAKKKFQEQFGRKGKKIEIETFAKKLDRYNKLLSEKAVELYKQGLPKGYIEQKTMGMNIDEKLNYMENITYEPLTPDEVDEIPDILKKMGI